jgi:DNA-directed RNA polymerase specialized sigma24 family protein
MGFSYSEIAVMLGRPTADAARVAVARALVRLAEALNNAR